MDSMRQCWAWMMSLGMGGMLLGLLLLAALVLMTVAIIRRSGHGTPAK